MLAGFGLALIVRGCRRGVEAALSRLIPHRPAAARGDGFWSGVVLGGSLGLVYAPCAGPILAGVITVSASQDFTAGRLGVAFSYAIGTAVVLYALMIGGRRLSSRLAKRSGRVQAAMGAVMVAVAVLMAFELDIRFQTSIADNLPAVLVNPSRGLEDSGAARERLAELRGGVAFGATRRASASGALPVLGRAPEIRGTQRWFNTPDGRSLSLAALRGRVVLIDFWTYSCINCIRTLPQLKAWDERYRERGLTIIGVHAPEFPFERDAGNVARAVRRSGLRYPVAQDNEFATWKAYGNQFWPAKYLIDARGRVRYTHFGEGNYARTDAAIRGLLAEVGSSVGAARVRVRTERPLTYATPESYLGYERAKRFVNGPLIAGTRTFELAGRIPLDHLGLEGRWRVEASRAVAAGDRARLRLRFWARRVFLVMGGAERRVGVRLDGRRRRPIRVTSHRLYEIVRLREPGTHLLTLAPQRGTEVYAFTFG